MSTYAVTCHQVCGQIMWESDTPPPGDDGQPIATAWADTNCARPDCPHTTTAINRARASAPVPRADFDAVLARLTALETKGDTP